jgi:hypothetical protein
MMNDWPELMKEASMFRGAKTFGCAAALMFGIQAAAAADLDCVNNQRVDYSGHVLRDANGKPVPCGYIGPTAEEDPMELYLGAGVFLVGGGIAALLATNNSSNGGGIPLLPVLPASP